MSVHTEPSTPTATGPHSVELRRSTRLKRLLIAASLIALASACGGGSSSGGVNGTTGPLSWDSGNWDSTTWN
jgi:hypothetical protein